MQSISVQIITDQAAFNSRTRIRQRVAIANVGHYLNILANFPRKLHRNEEIGRSSKEGCATMASPTSWIHHCGLVARGQSKKRIVRIFFSDTSSTQIN